MTAYAERQPFVRRNDPYEGKIVTDWRGSKVYRNGRWMPYQRQGTNDA